MTDDFPMLEKKYNEYDWHERWLWGFLFGSVSAWAGALVLILVTYP